MKNKTVVDDVISFIMAKGDEELASFTVERIADIFEIDRFKLSRKFKALQGETLAEYLTREKMIRSAFILGSDYDVTLSELAKRMGFCNAQYFSRAFKKCFGLTPGRYRAYKRLRSGVMDRRTGPVTRRQKISKKKSPPAERRKGLPDRRSGEEDRRSDTVKTTETIETIENVESVEKTRRPDLQDYLKDLQNPDKKK
jgi:AraC-like DNA-binding protein